MAQGYEDIRYEVDGATAVITIDRPERYNAFRGKTVDRDDRGRAVDLVPDVLVALRHRC